MYGLPIPHFPARKHWKGKHCTNKHWQHMAGSLDGADFSRNSSHHCSSSSKPELPPCQGMNSHPAPVRCVNTGAVPNAGQESLQVASQCHLSQLDCAPSQLWQAPSHLWKPPVNYRPLGWKVSSICQWKLMPMPHKFSANCPYLFIDLLMSFSLCLKGVGRKRARPGQLWHHASAVKTNWTFSPPGSPHYIPYLEHWFIQCYFLLC